ncbi:hypothetical protein C1645_839504 [Glomus cerebriforme]|uniref:Protein kinase domain-containing protein n=1 Tax=Glomus cerebriforme TaxID=658196 RepID=A0A397S3B2_9GLOM|nr:hypothetical protein C1645_839504 [Glomus cerebriforme]
MEILTMIKLFLIKEKKRICENCQKECLAILYCEYCIRNYLKENLSNWISENNKNNNIDDLIQECQMESLTSSKVVEWIPYSNLQNINYLTKGGCSKIYIADWIGGSYYKWNSEEQQLERYGTHEVILKRLKNVKSRALISSVQFSICQN